MGPFFVFSSDLKSWETSKLIFLTFQEATHALEASWHEVGSWLSTTVDSYITAANAAKENAKLRAENRRLRARAIDYEENMLELNRLRGLLSFWQRRSRELLATEVVGQASRLPFQSLRLSRGSASGIEIGMPVITDRGIAGRILRVGLGFSDMQTLTDTSFSLDVLLQRSRVRGVVHGTGDGLCELELHKRSEVRIGDTIVSSGMSGGFPKGIGFGRVMRISYDSDRVSQRILVDPWVDPMQLDEVFVILERDDDVQKILETAGQEWLEQRFTKEKGG